MKQSFKVDCKILGSLNAPNYFFVIFQLECNESGFNFLKAFVIYLWISKELCTRNLLLIVGLAKPTYKNNALSQKEYSRKQTLVEKVSKNNLHVTKMDAMQRT